MSRDMEECRPRQLSYAPGCPAPAGLRFVYVGNVAGVSLDTICPKCGDAVVKKTLWGDGKQGEGRHMSFMWGLPSQGGSVRAAVGDGEAFQGMAPARSRTTSSSSRSTHLV